jgi:AcrR family transcriptional regulator
MDRRTRKKELTRENLLNAARKLFAERGLFSTRVEDITERADMAKGAFYNYFSSKDELIAALLIEAAMKVEESAIDQVNRTSQPLTVRSVSRQLFEFLELHPEYSLLLHQTRGLLQLKPESSAVLQEAMSRFVRAIVSSLGLEKSSPPESMETVMKIGAALAGAVAGYRSFSNAIGNPPDADFIADVISRGLQEALLSLVKQHPV